MNRFYPMLSLVVVSLAFVSIMAANEFTGNALAKAAQFTSGDSGSSVTARCVGQTSTDAYQTTTVVYSGRKYTDKCVGDKVLEYYCKNDRKYSKYITCKTGEKCVSGSCLKPVAPQGNCYENDNGLDYENAGAVTYMGREYADTCYKSTRLKEYYCKNDRKYYRYKTCNCENGACVDETQGNTTATCRDLDNGKDYYTNGSVVVNGTAIYDDECMTSNRLKEYYCNGNTQAYVYKTCTCVEEHGTGRCRYANETVTNTTNQTNTTGCTPRYLSADACVNRTTGAWRQVQYQYSNCTIAWHDYQYCSYGCSNGDCTEAKEICSNNIDDDLDGLVDEIEESKSCEIEVKGQKHTVTLLGVSSPKIAVISVDGSSKEVTKGGSYVVSGLVVYVKDIDYQANENIVSQATFTFSPTTNQTNTTGCTPRYLSADACVNRTTGAWRQVQYQYSNCTIAWHDYQYCSYGCSNGDCLVAPAQNQTNTTNQTNVTNTTY